MLAAYTYTRPGELAALEWGDVDLEHGTIHVHKSIDRVRKSDVGSTKTETARRVPIEPELLPLLRVLRERAGGKGAVCSMPSPGMLSRKLRVYLERAGITRTELLVPTPTSKALTFYDLRATGITWCAVRGDDPLKIKQRAGHAAFTTTEIYIREAENIRAGFGVPFQALPERLLDKGPEKARAYPRSSKPSKNLGSIVGAIGFEPTTPTVSRQRARGFTGLRIVTGEPRRTQTSRKTTPGRFARVQLVTVGGSSMDSKVDSIDGQHSR